jgi:hypothetical protein
MKEDFFSFLGAVVFVLFAFVVIAPLAIIYYAWVATILANWFLVPLFNLPTFTLWSTAGIIVTIRALSMSYEVSYSTDLQTSINRLLTFYKLQTVDTRFRFIGQLLAPLVGLLIGFIIKSLMYLM